MTGILGEVEFEEIRRRVGDAIEGIRREFQRLVDNANRVLDWLPGFIVDRVMAALRTVGEIIGKVITEVIKFQSQPGRPWTLWTTGGTWTDAVGAKTSSWSESFSVGSMRTDDEWSGSAAEAYKNVLPSQQKALGAVKAACDEVDDLLGKLAIAIGVAWLAVVSALVTFVIELTAEATAAAATGGAGAPPAAAAAGGSAVKVAALVTAALGALEAFVGSTLLPSIKDLNQRVQNNEGFPRKHGSDEAGWPQLTKDISNSSHRQNKGAHAPWEMTDA
ncbi:MAG: hypothetical protein GEV28_02560 [Actinophytocola sp.]|uniref:hypothetical protein n=1 Tax=Actinophytocola sp. TaxID=1872138 RepID=UPI0013283244|nr:hypothetical protein [Actinophytocola sp.]MPZ79318.1 hypothetical protein [Actinophytocola sp.]